MAADDPLVLAAILVGAAFILPLFFAIYVRNVERRNREPMGAVFRAFFYGAFVSILIALVLEGVFQTNFTRAYQIEGFTLSEELILVVVTAPLVEEFAKALGVRGARRQIFELEDGIIYGAAAGLGFSATENLFYELSHLAENAGYSFVFVGVLRSFTSSFLHATASGILGYGMARRYIHDRYFIELLPYYAGAVLIHAGFNALAVFVNVGGLPVAGMMLILLVSAIGIRWTIGRIRRLDRSPQAAAAYRW